MTLHTETKNPLNIIVIVAALGYFVDIYDLILFGIVRTPSLNGLGITEPELVTEYGLHLLSYQMIGMLTGGLLWGIMGDKKGRVSVLFGSIIMYSIANIANAYVKELADYTSSTIINTYTVLRFIAGVGLAGELGAGITLVNETMTKEHRGYGTMIVVSFGVLGAVFANILGHFVTWQSSYIIGGVMGLVLLFLRIGVYESGMFINLQVGNRKKGNLFMLFNNKKRFLTYLSSIAVGVPIWYMIGILVVFSPEIAKMNGISGVNGGDAIMYFYLATCLGDFLSAYWSQKLKSRKKILVLYLIIAICITPVYLYMMSHASVGVFYFICSLLGFASGYWAVFVTTASEQFGTNIRATVTTTVPNMVRGSLAILTFLLAFFRDSFRWNMIDSMFAVGIIAIAGAFLSLFGIKESYTKDLNYIES
ncbi:MAG TPA: MFS transporter [Bacteroidia bacterium]|nr:MFS transporter [Bacteroidia bacterium]HMU20415.1 MFS transporter [Bacteroidia bacterium]